MGGLDTRRNWAPSTRQMANIISQNGFPCSQTITWQWWWWQAETTSTLLAVKAMLLMDQCLLLLLFSRPSVTSSILVDVIKTKASCYTYVYSNGNISISIKPSWWLQRKEGHPHLVNNNHVKCKRTNFASGFGCCIDNCNTPLKERGCYYYIENGKTHDQWTLTIFQLLPLNIQLTDFIVRKVCSSHDLARENKSHLIYRLSRFVSHRPSMGNFDESIIWMMLSRSMYGITKTLPHKKVGY